VGEKNMDYGGILRRAWRITWDNKYLWWLGLLTALGSGGGGRGSSSFRGSNFGGDGPGFGPGGFPDFDPGSLPPGVVPGIIAIICLLLLLAVAIWVVSTIARGGLISAANQIEDAEKSSFREGWRAGVETMWRMLGVSVVQGLPGIVVGLGALVLLALGVFTFGGLSDPSTFDPTNLLAGGGILLALCLVPLACIVGLLSLALAILRPFADRACVIEDERVFASYRRGWEVLRDNFGDSLVLGIIRIVVSFLIGLVVAVPIIILGLIAGVSFGLGGLAAGPDILPAVAAPLIVVIACVVLLLLVIGLTISAVMTTYFSSMWTLAYRQFTGTELEADIAPADAPAPV
jgi:hypothetical protein